MNIKRMRGRTHRSGGGGGGGGGSQAPRTYSGNVPLNRNHVFDSNGPDLRVRGTAQQLFEKYLQLGRDATSASDRVMAESYFQHAEHYFRIVNAINQAAQQNQGPYQQQPGGQQNGQRRQNGEGYETDEPNGQPQPPMHNGPQTYAEQGYGDQPGPDSREIPISVTAPEG